MKRLVEMTEVPKSVKSWVTKARKAPVVLTIKGRPVAAATPLDQCDWERLVVSGHPAFRKAIEESRERCHAGQGISTAEIRPRWPWLALLDTVVLTRDLPEHGLRAGDVGAVAELYGEDGVEVEFVRASGQTKALVTLAAADVRAVDGSDMLTVRTA